MFILLALLLSCADSSDPWTSRDVVPERTSNPAKPNVLLISIDTLRADHLGAYGYDKPTSPSLDKLAQQGIRYRRATSVTNWTLPAHMSLMTGAPPSAHRVLDDRDKLPSDRQTLAQVMSANGYATAGFTSHVYLGEKFGFDRGFDSYATQPNQRAPAVTNQALEWLTQRDDEPFFLFLHYFDPHWNFDPPEKWALRFGADQPKLGTLDALFPYFLPENTLSEEHKRAAIALYDAEIAFTDFHVGRVLGRLQAEGVLDNTIVVVLSDHGEAFGEHGTFGHGTHLHNEVTHVPLIMRFPRAIDAGTVSELRMSQTDVPRAILELAGQDVPQPFSEHSVAWRATSRGAFVSESTRWGPMRYAVHADTLTHLTTSWYQPLSFAKVDGKSKAILLDPQPLNEVTYRASDHTESKPIQATPAQLAPLNATLQNYNRSHPGYTLSCSAATNFSLHFKSALPDEIYTVSAPANVSFTELKKRLSYRLSFNKNGGAIGIAAHDPFAASIRWGAENQAPLVPGEPLPEDVPCVLTANGVHVNEATTDLSAEERALLEELGYIE